MLWPKEVPRIYLLISGVWEIRVGHSKIFDLAWDDRLVLVDKSSPNHNETQVSCNIIQSSSYVELSIQTLLVNGDKSSIDNFRDFISWRFNYFYRRWLHLCLNDSYREVRYSLEWLASTPTKIRMAISAIYFVTNTSKVSRSHALSIIKALRIGGYVEMKEGYLIRLLKALPERY
ncbi:helix-turn-helix domain-containing protein [Pseudomonas sp. NPDC098747]|uniref:helix-turn-helix domain-containing protein n=1 Tax=Pseudomonas sp. NPDC098747 TaxID=3364487 RepID=UPI00383AF62B